MRRIISVILISLCLASCGFHLRGVQPVNPELQTMYFKTAEPYGQLTRNLKQYFTMSGVNLTDTPNAANYVFDLMSETQREDLISVSGTQQTRQYNLVLTTVFQITKPDGTVVLPPQTISRSSVFTMQANQILGGSNEETSMYDQMRQDIVFDVMNRLSSLEVAQRLKDAKKQHETGLSTT